MNQPNQVLMLQEILKALRKSNIDHIKVETKEMHIFDDVLVYGKRIIIDYSERKG